MMTAIIILIITMIIFTRKTSTLKQALALSYSILSAVALINQTHASIELSIDRVSIVQELATNTFQTQALALAIIYGYTRLSHCAVLLLSSFDIETLQSQSAVASCNHRSQTLLLIYSFASLSGEKLFRASSLTVSFDINMSVCLKGP